MVLVYLFLYTPAEENCGNDERACFDMTKAVGWRMDVDCLLVMTC